VNNHRIVVENTTFTKKFVWSLRGLGILHGDYNVKY